MGTSLPYAFILVATLWASATQAQMSGGPHRVPTVTRLVMIFTNLEYELMTAVRKGDSTAINKMVVDDFELRSGAMPGVPTPRAEWLQHSQGHTAGSIEQMAVHDYGTAAVVSFLWKSAPKHEISVVDVWKKSGNSWKLSVRYASPGGDTQFQIPGAVLETPKIKKMTQ